MAVFDTTTVVPYRGNAALTTSRHRMIVEGVADLQDESKPGGPAWTGTLTIGTVTDHTFPKPAPEGYLLRLDDLERVERVVAVVDPSASDLTTAKLSGPAQLPG